MIYPTKKSNTDDLLVRECNGLVMRKTDFKIISMGQMLMREIVGQIDDKETRHWTPGNYTEIQYAIDCPVVKVFYYDNEWVISTNKRLNAKHAKWFSEIDTFYDYFEQCVCSKTSNDVQNALSSYLDKNTTYSFGIMHPNTHHIIKYNDSNLMLLCQRDMTTLNEIDIYGQEDTDLYTIPKYWNTLPNTDYRGLIVIRHRNDPIHVERFKTDDPIFKLYDTIKGNHPTFKDAYICTNAYCKMLLKLGFPQYPFDEIDATLMKLSDDMLKNNVGSDIETIRFNLFNAMYPNILSLYRAFE